MAPAELDRRVAAVRRFNRFYTRKIGVLQEHAYRSPFSLTQVRVLYELAHRREAAAADLGRELGLDAGYLSRILRGFEQRGYLARTRSADDGRRQHLTLTATGRRVFHPLDARSQADIAALLEALPGAEQARLVSAMESIEHLLGAPREAPPTVVLRAPEPGDIGWVIHRHGLLYAREYGYSQEFEALVAEIAARFVQRLDPKRERCWIAERDGEIVGSVFVVAQSKTVAKLRLLYVEPEARGAGIGGRLVSECVRFAAQAGYRKLVLWTQSELRAARRLYEAAGFTLVGKERHHSFGRDLVAETWQRPL